MGFKERLATLLAPVQMLWLSLRLHVAALRETLSLAQFRDVAVAKLFVQTSDGFIAYEDTTVVPSLVASCSGTVLELGPGPGNQLHRLSLNAHRIDRIYAVEPNPFFARTLLQKAQQQQQQQHQHDGASLLQHKYRLVTCGIEDSQVLREAGVDEASLDCVLSIQVLCSVGNVRAVTRELYRLLKPGGRFVFWEHGRHHDDGFTALVQACWNPVWSALVGGCCVTRDIKAAVLAAGEWQNPEAIEQGTDPYDFTSRTWGILVKKP